MNPTPARWIRSIRNPITMFITALSSFSSPLFLFLYHLFLSWWYQHWNLSYSYNSPPPPPTVKCNAMAEEMMAKHGQHVRDAQWERKEVLRHYSIPETSHLRQQCKMWVPGVIVKENYKNGQISTYCLFSARNICQLRAHLLVDGHNVPEEMFPPLQNVWRRPGTPEPGVWPCVCIYWERESQRETREMRKKRW